MQLKSSKLSNLTSVKTLKRWLLFFTRLGVNPRPQKNYRANDTPYDTGNCAGMRLLWLPDYKFIHQIRGPMLYFSVFCNSSYIDIDNAELLERELVHSTVITARMIPSTCLSLSSFFKNPPHNHFYLLSR